MSVPRCVSYGRYNTFVACAEVAMLGAMYCTVLCSLSRVGCEFTKPLHALDVCSCVCSCV